MVFDTEIIGNKYLRWINELKQQPGKDRSLAAQVNKEERSDSEISKYLQFTIKRGGKESADLDQLRFSVSIDKV